MQKVLFALTLFVVLWYAVAGWSVKYAVDCPSRCDLSACPKIQHCKRTVMDDCGCCWVCAAGRGEICYRTVSGMDGVKCGPGLRCHFYTEEDDFGDEFGTCKECPYGTYGVECRKTCNCQTGICDRENGKCMKFPFFQLPASKPANRRRFVPQPGTDTASGDGNANEDVLKEKVIRSPGMKRLSPR
ncbi:endothelial cell-specific molecule 1 [Latimeria chalumnae]|uniref:Endothelial cell specific molecule 1 n=1 Tax=Latimeria chalumnae TaxID=7897 RepID=H3A5C7_LATCH|nr:PREDICTED: endothelial cell-specific molecule 1 [Latimeria chalumnae]|eukprot:XP_014350656.1 PREDICTED: endothelial cell-specific molecule 1 [Latimeria chalumnae]